MELFHLRIRIRPWSLWLICFCGLIAILFAYFHTKLLLWEDYIWYMNMSWGMLNSGLLNEPGRHWPTGYPQLLISLYKLTGFSFGTITTFINVFSFAVITLIQSMIFFKLSQNRNEFAKWVILSPLALMWFCINSHLINAPLSEMPFLMFTFTALFSLGATNERNHTRNLIISTVFAFLAFRMRYVGVILVAPISCQFILLVRSGKISMKGALRDAALSATALLILIAVFYHPIFFADRVDMFDSRKVQDILPRLRSKGWLVHLFSFILVFVGRTNKDVSAVQYLELAALVIAILLVITCLCANKQRLSESGLEFLRFRSEKFLISAPFLIWGGAYFLFMTIWLLNARTTSIFASRYLIPYVALTPLLAYLLGRRIKPGLLNRFTFLFLGAFVMYGSVRAVGRYNSGDHSNVIAVSPRAESQLPGWNEFLEHVENVDQVVVGTPHHPSHIKMLNPDNGQPPVQPQAVMRYFEDLTWLKGVGIQNLNLLHLRGKFFFRFPKKIMLTPVQAQVAELKGKTMIISSLTSAQLKKQYSIVKDVVASGQTNLFHSDISYLVVTRLKRGDIYRDHSIGMSQDRE